MYFIVFYTRAPLVFSILADGKVEQVALEVALAARAHELDQHLDGVHDQA